MQHFLLKRADGSVAIMVADDDTTCEAEIAKWSPEMQAEIIGHEPLELTAVPTDRYFRNAWTHVAASRAVGKVAVDMVKAREIHRDVLRRSRKPLLEAADVDYIKADEAADEPRKAEVRAYKQALRDVPQDPRIDAAQTPRNSRPSCRMRCYERARISSPIAISAATSRARLRIRTATGGPGAPASGTGWPRPSSR